MKSLGIASALCLPLLASCGGGGSATIPSLEHTVSAANVSSEAQTQARTTAALAPLASTPGHLLYVGNLGNNSITVYKNSASGDTAPLYAIAGSKTGIDSPGQLSEDAAGNLYVANGAMNPSVTSPAVLVFAHGAQGNVAPIRKLSGPLTGLHRIYAMTVDQTTGKIFVVDYFASSTNYFASLLRFAPDASGNAAPLARSTASLLLAEQLANDSTGKNVIEAHTCAIFHCDAAGVSTYAKQFANGMSAAEPDSIEELLNSGVADDPTTKTYLLSTAQGIYRLPEGASGAPAANGLPSSIKPPPVSIITSDTCAGQLAVAPGPTPDTYAVHSKAAGCATDAVDVYANTAGGDATPVRVLSGPATKLNEPYGIYEGN